MLSIIHAHGVAPVHAVSRASVVVSCPCGEVYELRPEYAGRLLECPACGRHLRAGPSASAPRPPTPGVDHAFDRDVFLLRERVFTITSKYEVWAEDGTPILYVERPTYPIRTLVAYLLAAIVTLTIMGWAAGEPLAILRKTYLHNIVRKRWYVTTPEGAPLAMAIEDSIVLSLLRRVMGTFFGFLRTNFVFVRGADAEIFGEFNRKFTLLDRYVLDLSTDSARTFDRRIAVALGVMLDTGERR